MRGILASGMAPQKQLFINSQLSCTKQALEMRVRMDGA
jgi:hypothetical protein